MASPEPVEVYSARDLPEAQFVKDLLSEAGIEATIVGEPLGAVLGDIPAFEAAPRIWVLREDRERARSIIDDYERRRKIATDSAEPAYCYHCGEPVSRGQSPCPACQGVLDWLSRDS